MDTLPPKPPCIILVEPRSAANVGMVCRAMANFGADELRLVNPAAPLGEEARRLAVFAAPLLEEAKTYPDLTEAVADLHLSIATTRRTGKLRGDLLPLPRLREHLDLLPASARTGLVFGRESAGLTTDEVSLCSLAATIPTRTETGSLNLAQAVTLSLYEWNREDRAAKTPARDLPRQEESEALFRLVARVLDRVAFLNRDRPEAVLHPLRALHHRAAPDAGELRLLRGMWEQLDASVRDWEGRRRGKNPEGESG